MNKGFRNQFEKINLEFSTSYSGHSVGSLRILNLRILVRFLKKQTDSARCGLEADIQFYLVGKYKLES
jgi:hypothetical protein